MTTRRIIILVFVMLFSVRLFTANTYFSEQADLNFGVEMLTKFPSKSTAFKELLDVFVSA